jgi:HlyD family secretion protein
VAILDQTDALSNLQSAQGGLESANARLSQAVTNAKVTKIQTQSAIDQAQASLNAALSKLQVVKKPSRNQERMVAENRVASAEAYLDNAEANFKRNDQLYKKGAISAASFDVAKTQYLVAQADYRSAKEQLSLIDEGGRHEDISTSQSQVEVAREQLRAAKANASQNLLRQEDIKSAQAGVRQARAAVALAKQQLDNTYIKSPISGDVSARTAEPGQVVSPGQTLATIVNLSSVYFKGDISEKDLASINKGQSVNVQIDAITGKVFHGIVTEIYPAGSTTNRNFSVRISIPQAAHLLKPGMFARGEIVTGVSRNVMLVPKDAIDDRKGTQSVFTLEPNKTVKRHIVSVIRENRDYSLIQTPTDLKVDDTVITEGRQNMQDGIKVQVHNEE